MSNCTCQCCSVTFSQTHAFSVLMYEAQHVHEHTHTYTLTATMPVVNSSRETVSSLSSELMKLRMLATRCTVRVRPLDFHLLSQSSQLQTTWMSTEAKVGGWVCRSHDDHVTVLWSHDNHMLLSVYCFLKLY